MKKFTFKKVKQVRWHSSVDDEMSDKKKKRPRFSDEDNQQLLELIWDDLPIKQIAEKLGRSQ